MSVGLIYHPIYLEHDTGIHCEVASRLTTTMLYLKSSGTMDKLVSIQPQAATIEQIARVHAPSYIAAVESFVNRGGGCFSGTFYISRMNGGLDAGKIY